MKSPLLLPLVASLVVLQACSTVDQRNCDTQPAARVDTVVPTATAVPGEGSQATVSVTPAAPIAVAIPVAGPAPAVMASPEAAPVTVEEGKAPTLLDRYTVAPGDTLAGIAARKDVYGDARLWPLLYRANVQLIGPRGVIFPNQVLFIGRNHTPEEVNALIAQPRRAMSPASVAKPAVAPPAVAVTSVETAPGTKPIEIKVAETTPGEVKTVEVGTTDGKAAALPVGEAPKGAPAADARSIKPIEYLNSARRAFSAGDVPWATYYYSVYLEQKNDDANAWGELGNVYYFEGNLADAAKAYYNAASLLIDRGLTARAVDLFPVIEEGEPGLAEALHQRLTTIKR